MIHQPSPPPLLQLSDAGDRLLNLGVEAGAGRLVQALAGHAVRAPGAAFYWAPARVYQVLDRDGLQLLEEALTLVHDLNAQHQGRPALDVLLDLSDDPDVLDLRERLRTWVPLMVEGRVQRRAHRRSEDPREISGAARLFMGLRAELGEWFGHLFLKGPPDFAVVGGELASHYDWESMHQSIGSHLDGLTRPQHVPLEQWNEVQFWRRRLGGFHASLVAAMVRCPDVEPGLRRTWALKQLRHFGAELGAMRRGLLGRVRPEETVREVSPGLWSAWSWWSLSHLGEVTLGPTEEAVRAALRVDPGAEALGDGVARFSIDHRGRLTLERMSWVTVDALERTGLDCWLPPGLPFEEATLRLVRLNVAVLRGILLDQEALFRELVGDLETMGKPGAEGEAADLDLLGDLEPLEAARERCRAASQLRSIRYQPLIRLLSDHFSVRVRQGRGSEVVLQRPGRRSYILGHHRRNEPVGAYHIYRLLRVFEISLDDWLAATS